MTQAGAAVGVSGPAPGATGQGACPECGTRLREGGRYCSTCGLEVRHACPSCTSATALRWLAMMDPGADPWCAECDALLHACRDCGRWQLPLHTRCENPRCGGRVLPTVPQHTCRQWDGGGGGVGWRWPPEWDNRHGSHREPQRETLELADPIHAAFVACGRLHTWEARRLLAYRPHSWGGPVEPLWRCGLGAGIPANDLPVAERVAVAGATAFLALEQHYLLVDLSGSGATEPMPTGAPMAHVGMPGWWAGWSIGRDGPMLCAAPVSHRWDAPAGEYTKVATPPESVPLPGSRMIGKNCSIAWIAERGGVWTADLQAGTVTEAIREPARARAIWYSSRGVAAVIERDTRLAVSIPAALGYSHRELAAGNAPMREALASGDEVVVVGARPTLVNLVRGATVEATQSFAAWVEGVLVPSGEAEPLLLALTNENGSWDLTVAGISSGFHTSLARGSSEAQGLMACGKSLYVVHAGGITRLY